MNNIQRSYKLRFYPTASQIQQLDIAFGHARFVWNWALDMRIKAYKRREQSLNNVPISRVLTKLKKSYRYHWLSDAPGTIYTQRLRDLDKAYSNFFKGTGKFPRFKKRRYAQSVRMQLDQRCIANYWRPDLHQMKLTGLGAVKLKWSRVPVGTPKMATISRDACGRYFVSVSVDEEIAVGDGPKHAAVGVDLGISHLAILSTGEKIDNPRHLYRRAYQLKRAQRRMAKMRKGSGRWHKQKLKVARLHARVADSRKDVLHKLSSRLIHENQVVCLEDLHVKGMLRNHRLVKALSDVGFGELRRQLEYNADWNGREVKGLDRWASG